MNVENMLAIYSIIGHSGTHTPASHYVASDSGRWWLAKSAIWKEPLQALSPEMRKGERKQKKLLAIWSIIGRSGMHTPASHSVPFTFFRLLAILFRYLKKKHCLFLEDKKERRKGRRRWRVAHMHMLQAEKRTACFCRRTDVSCVPGCDARFKQSCSAVVQSKRE